MGAHSRYHCSPAPGLAVAAASASAVTALVAGLWTLVLVPTTTTPKASCPQQNNGCDCGLFTCMAADYIANNQLDLAYDQGAMPAFRRRMAARIIAGTLDAEEARQPGAPLRSECL